MPAVQTQGLVDATPADQPRWAVIGSSSTRGRKDLHCRDGVVEPTQRVGANPLSDGFFDRHRHKGNFLRGSSGGVFLGRGRGDPQVSGRCTSRTRSRQEPAEGGYFEAQELASSTHSNHRQQYGVADHDPSSSTRAAPRRATTRPLQGNYFRQGPGDREDLVRERERCLKRRPFRQREEDSGTNRRNLLAAPPVWLVKEANAEAGTFGSTRVCVPLAMTVDDYYDKHSTDSLDLDTRGALGNRHANPSNHPNTQSFANNNGCSRSNNRNEQRYVGGSNNDNDWSFNDSGKRLGGTSNHGDNTVYCDHNHADDQSSQTTHHYDAESRVEKRGRWCYQWRELERKQPSLQAGAPSDSSHLAGCVLSSNESCGWAQGKFDVYNLTGHSPTH